MGAMNPEISAFGLFLPSLLVWAPIAYALTIVLRATLRALGLYRHLWHRALFNVAAFVCFLGAIVLIISRVPV
jgi:hypothetical protein